MRYDLIYAQSSYVYTVIVDLPHPRRANAPGASHILHHILNKVMVIHMVAPVPPTLMPHLQCVFRAKQFSTYLPNGLSSTIVSLCMAEWSIPSRISTVASHASSAPATTAPLGSSVCVADCDQSQKFREML